MIWLALVWVICGFLLYGLLKGTAVNEGKHYGYGWSFQDELFLWLLVLTGAPILFMMFWILMIKNKENRKFLGFRFWN